MSFPVDVLNSYSHEDLESSAENYLSDLRCGNPDQPEFLSLPNHRKVRASKYPSPSFLHILIDLKDLTFLVHKFCIT